MLKTDITDLIGNTPLLKLKGTNIYAKLEYFNPLHSVKDRAALYMINGAEARGDLKAGGTIIEPTSGNTGVGLAYIGATRGYKVILTMPESMSEGRKKLLRTLGAELILTPASEGMKGSIKKAEEIFASTPNSYMPLQFKNPDNARSHEETTAKEIIKDLGDIKPDYLVIAMGSGGTITGTSRGVKAVYPKVTTVLVEPYESPLISKGYAGPHKIQGIGANFVPELLDMRVVDKVMTVKGDDAIKEAEFAAKTYGTFVGITSGAALCVSKEIAKDNPDAVIVTIFPDTGERYL